MRLGSDLPTETGREGCYLPRYLPFKGMAPRSCEKDILGPRADRWPSHFQKDLYTSQKEKVKVKSLSLVWLFVTPWTVAHQAPPSMGFTRQEYWSGLPFPSPGDLPNPGIEPRSPTLQADALTSEPPGKPSTQIANVEHNEISYSEHNLFKKYYQHPRHLPHLVSVTTSP